VLIPLNFKAMHVRTNQKLQEMLS